MTGQTRTLLTTLLLAPLAVLHAADAAPLLVRWGGMTNPNMVSTATGLPEDPGSNAPLWEVKLGTHQYSIPTLDGGRVYIGASDAVVTRPGYTPSGGGVVMCVDQATGTALEKSLRGAEVIVPLMLRAERCTQDSQKWESQSSN